MQEIQPVIPVAFPQAHGFVFNSLSMVQFGEMQLYERKRSCVEN